jgi:hypothetical protein
MLVVVGIFVSYYVFVGDRDFVFQGINIISPWYVFPFILSSPLLISLVVDLYREVRGLRRKENKDIILANEKPDVKTDKEDIKSEGIVNVNELLVPVNENNAKENSSEVSDKLEVGIVDVQNMKSDEEGLSSKEHDDKGVVSDSVVDERIKSIEVQVKSLQDELKVFKDSVQQNIQDVKDAIISLRSSISEIDNPFNFMKKYAEVFGIDALEKLEQSKVVVSSQGRHDLSDSEGERVISVSGDQRVYGSNRSPVYNDKMSGVSHGVRMEPGKIVNIVVWANRMFLSFGKDYTLRVLDFYRSVGLVDENVYDAMVKALELVDKSKHVNVTVKDHVAMMVELMKVLGLDKQYHDLVSIVEALFGSGGSGSG